MPQRRALGALSGLGEGLLAYGENRVRRREREQALADQHAFALQQAQLQAMLGLGEKVMDDPLTAHRRIQIAHQLPLLQSLGSQLDLLEPSDPEKAAEIRRRIMATKDAADLPDVGALAEMSGMKDIAPLPPSAPTPPAVPGAPPVDVRGPGAPVAGTQLSPLLHADDFPEGSPVPDLAPAAPPTPPVPNIAPAEELLPQLRAQFPSNNPTMTSLQGAAQQQKTKLRVGEEDKLALDYRRKFGEADAAARAAAGLKDERFETNVTQAERMAKANAVGGGRGQEIVEAESFEAKQKRANESRKQLGLIDAQMQALAAGLSFDQLNTPARQAVMLAMVEKKAQAEAKADAMAKQELRAYMQKMGIMDDKVISAALQMQDNFRQESNAFNVRELSYRTLRAAAKEQLALPDETQVSPQAALSVIFAYMKLLDPLSAIQQNEQASAANAGKIPDDIQRLWNLARAGNKSQLTVNQIKGFLHEGANQYAGARSAQDRVVQSFTDRATQLNIPPHMVVRSIDPTLDIDLTGTTAPGGAAGSNDQRLQRLGQPPPRP